MRNLIGGDSAKSSNLGEKLLDKIVKVFSHSCVSVSNDVLKVDDS